MTVSSDFLFVAIAVMATGLALGLVADIFIFVFWHKLEKHISTSLSSPSSSWGLKEVGLFICFYFGLQLVFSLIGLLFSSLHLFSKETLRYLSLFWATFGVNVIVFLTLLAYLAHHYHILWGDLGLKSKHFFKHVGIGVLSYIGFIPVFFLLVLLSVFICSILGIEPKPHTIIEIFQEEKSGWVILSLAFFASLAGPVLEEIFFRGFLYPAAKKAWGIKIGIFISSAFFAAVHFNAFQFLPILGLGLLLTFLYEKTGSLTSSITLHILNNSVSLALTLYLLKM